MAQHAAAPARGFGNVRHESDAQRRPQFQRARRPGGSKAHIEGITGWSIGPEALETNLVENNDSADVDDLYDKLQNEILPLYYADDGGAGWARVMKGAIGKNACYFNTHRMMRQYVTEAYIR